MDNVPVQLLLFGLARELACASVKAIEVPHIIDRKELTRIIFDELCRELIDIREVCILSLNGEYIFNDEPFVVDPNSEIAVIPPISGG
ncbi:hypothetical protein AB6A40_001940 [Gnathostoma spinigerum]|uniref:Molybdopterin synthase sulfur carrier subunit n=1 Tax=Gnathostoma spinigerum TaxID=75299 RepID=A0ABD6E6M5_9BILA